MVSPAARRGVVSHLRDQLEISERRACRLIGLARAVWRYRARPDRNVDVRARLVELAALYPRYGYEMLHLKLSARALRSTTS
jgi:putative transposase